jgi:hypothetical protein
VRRPLFEVKMPDTLWHRLPQDTNGRFSLTAVFAMGVVAAPPSGRVTLPDSTRKKSFSDHCDRVR